MGDGNGITYANSTNFKTVVLNAPRPVLVDFWAPWCGPCKVIGPVLEEIAHGYADKLDVVKVNVDDCREVALQYGVRSIPPLIMMREGKVLDTTSGAMPKSQLAAFIDRHIA